MIALIGGEKGGTGKTTLATNLAAKRVLAGRDVLLVDADAQGRTVGRNSVLA
jgi:chromosome partitioning protein